MDTFIGGLPLHHLEFLTLITARGARDLIPLGIVSDGGLEAIIPLVTEHRGPKGIVRFAKNVNFYDGLVPQIPAEHILTLLDLVKQEAKRNLVGLMTFAVFPDRPLDASSIDRLREHGYDVDKSSSFVIPIDGRNTSDVRRFANRRIYRNIEHAKKYNVQVRDATEREMEEIFTHLQITAYEATGGRFPFSPTVFGDIWRHYHEDPRFSMRTAYVRTSAYGEEIVVGMSLMIDNGKMANFWKLATRKGYDHVQPSTVLYWDAIKTAAAKGLEAIDTGPAASRGIAEYKMQWGSIKVPYYYIQSVTLPLYYPVAKLRAIFTRVVSRQGIRKLRRLKTWLEQPIRHFQREMETSNRT